jgi:hypothetical protein
LHGEDKRRVDGTRFGDMSSRHTAAPPPPGPLPGQLMHSVDGRNLGRRVEDGGETGRRMNQGSAASERTRVRDRAADGEDGGCQSRRGRASHCQTHPEFLTLFLLSADESLIDDSL